MSDDTRPSPPLDEALLAAYRRQKAPPGFALRVAARIPDRAPARTARWRRPALAAAALALAVLAPMMLVNRSGTHVAEPAEALVSVPTFPTSPAAPGELSVPGLSAIGDVPLFPAHSAGTPDTPGDAAPPGWEGKAVPKPDEFRYARRSEEPRDDHA